MHIFKDETDFFLTLLENCTVVQVSDHDTTFPAKIYLDEHNETQDSVLESILKALASCEFLISAGYGKITRSNQVFAFTYSKEKALV